MQKELKELKADIMMMNGWYDKYGEAVSWHFSICDALQLREVHIPESWQYQSGILGPDDENFDLDILKDYKTKTLIRMGHILHRYARLCDRAGLSY